MQNKRFYSYPAMEAEIDPGTPAFTQTAQRDRWAQPCANSRADEHRQTGICGDFIEDQDADDERLGAVSEERDQGQKSRGFGGELTGVSGYGDDQSQYQRDRQAHAEAVRGRELCRVAGEALQGGLSRAPR